MQPTHTPRWQVHQLFVQNRLLFTDSVQEEFVKAYPGLRFVTDEETKIARSLVVNTLSEQVIEDLVIDLQFFLNNPNLPTKYITANLNRFDGNPKLLEQARRTLRCSGAVLVGPAASGKRYLAAAIAKYWISQGMELCLAVNGVKEVTANQVWVFSNYQAEQIRPFFYDVLKRVHHLRSVLIVTTTQELDLPAYYGRRMQELCEPRPLAQWEGDLQPQIHSLTAVEQLKRFFDQQKIVTPAVIQQLMLHYSALIVRERIPEVTFLEPHVLDRLTHDLAFFITFPGVPVDHICSRISTFNTEEENPLFTQILKFAQGEGTRGCFLSGPTGSGKTHLAIGLAKRFFHTYHDKLYFVTPESATGFLKADMSPGQFWIFDDINFYNSYPLEMIALLQKAIVHTRTHGGMLLVTSCISWAEIVQECANHDQPLDQTMAQSLFFSN